MLRHYIKRILEKIYDRLKEEDRQVLELDFGNNLDKLKGEYYMKELSQMY